MSLLLLFWPQQWALYFAHWRVSVSDAATAAVSLVDAKAAAATIDDAEAAGVTMSDA